MSTESQGSGTGPLSGKVEFTRVGVWSMAKISAVVYAVIGLIPGVFITLGFLLALATNSESPWSGPTPFFGLLFGVGALIGMPIFYGILGFVAGAISAWVYNLVASKIGGVVTEIRQL